MSTLLFKNNLDGTTDVVSGGINTLKINADKTLATATPSNTMSGNNLATVGQIPSLVVTSISGLLTADTSKVVNVLNYHTGLEGGGGVFYWDAAKPATKHNGGTIISPLAVFPTDWNDQTQLTAWFAAPTNGVGCWVRQYDGAVSVKWFGAKGDGATDDSAVLTTISRLGGNYFLPIGTYNFEGIVPTSNFTLVGERKELSILTLKDNTNDHAIGLTNVSNIVIKNLSLFCNRPKQTGGHGLRFGGVDSCTIEDVHVQSPTSYGIGMQAGTNKNILINNFSCDDSGQDGIDIKDYNLNNENITLTNLSISDWGRSSITQTAVDIRGGIKLDGLFCKLTSTPNPANMTCFRFREESVQGRAGFGVVNNIVLNADIGVNTQIITVSAGCKDYVISNVEANRCTFVGVISGAGGLIKNIVVDTAVEPFSIFGDNLKIDNVQINSITGSRFADIEPTASGNRFTNIYVNSSVNTELFRVQSGSTNTYVRGGTVPANSTIGAVTFDEIRIIDLDGFKTKTYLQSNDLLVDSTGTRTFTIPHGLKFTPKVENMQLTLSRSTGAPGDYRLSYAQIDYTTSTTVVGRVSVNSPSATAGAAIKANVLIDAFSEY